MKEKVQGDLTNLRKSRVFYKEYEATLSSVVPSDRTKGNVQQPVVAD